MPSTGREEDEHVFQEWMGAASDWPVGRRSLDAGPAATAEDRSPSYMHQKGSCMGKKDGRLEDARWTA